MKYLFLTLLIILQANFLFASDAEEAFAQKLKKRPSALHIVYDEEALRIPNQVLKVGFEAEMADGQIFSSRNIGGKLGARNFIVSVTGGRYAFGKVTIDSDNYSGEIKITVKARRFLDVIASVSLPIHVENAAYSHLSTIVENGVHRQLILISRC